MDMMFAWGQRTYVMGVLNLTPDSFSGDGLDRDVEAAVARARMMVAAGADVLDVGGESTRPGAEPIAAEEEIARVVPVIECLARELACPISVDTYKSSVARAALQAGARIVNDVWGLRMDPSLARVAAEADVMLILTRNARPSQHAAWNHQTMTGPLVERIRHALAESIALAQRAGVSHDNIIIDPGIGFGASWQENPIILNELARLRTLGYPIVVGPSRKGFIGHILGVSMGERLEGTASAVAVAVARGADMVRVHDVESMVRVVRMADAIVRNVRSA
jgi:dihydropteroate synthase